MQLTDFHFELPPELIAQQPLPERSASRLLQVDGASGALTDFSLSLSDAVVQTLCGYWDAQTVDAQQRLLDAWERGDDVALIVQVTGRDGRVIVGVDVGAFVEVDDAPPAPGTGNYL